MFVENDRERRNKAAQERLARHLAANQRWTRIAAWAERRACRAAERIEQIAN